jgi:maltooligosyltrehalose trehalohydrolase
MTWNSAERRLPIGAEMAAEGGVRFRVWAPKRKRVEVVLEGDRLRGEASPESQSQPLEREEAGYFSGRISTARAGSLYRFRLDGESALYPDPASRFQPDGPHGPSEVVDPDSFYWSDNAWSGVRREGQVIYELHLGTFMPEGNWAAAERKLPHLAETGITVLEIMPIAEFPGRFGWGYDGVDLFAPAHIYGRPDDVRRFVDQAHAHGLGVILDVVYNHVGPDGNYLKAFADQYFTDRYTTDWGEAINFDGEGAGPVREFFVANAGYWIDEFHFDGLRLDATQNIYDSSGDHIVAAIGRRVRQAAGRRTTFVVAENEPQHVQLVRSLDEGGYGLDALWNDDFHHSARVALTGHKEAYYSDYQGTPQEFVSAVKRGFLYQGQLYGWQRKTRGTPTRGLTPAAFVTFLDNHDQVANSARGLRSRQLTSPGRYRTLTAFFLLAPQTPMLFQGQEFGATSPFDFFADHNPGLARLVRKGRAQFLSQFPSITDPAMQAALPDPGDPRDFERCKLDWSECTGHRELVALHRDLLRLRREDNVFRVQQVTGEVDGAVLSEQAFVLRFFGKDGDDRLLLFNLGRDLRLEPAPEPLLAPPAGRAWALLWSSEHPGYGGSGQPHFDPQAGWRLRGEAAVVFRAEPPKGSGNG